MVNIEVTVKSIVYRDDYDMYALEVIFHHETKVGTASLQSITPAETLPSDMKVMIQTLRSMITPQLKVNTYDDMLTGNIYLTEDEYNTLGRFGVGTRLQLRIDTGSVR